MNYTRITETTPNLVHAGQCKVHGISINRFAQNVIAIIYDDINDNADIRVLNFVNAGPELRPRSMDLDGVIFKTGIYVVIINSPLDMTIMWEGH